MGDMGGCGNGLGAVIASAGKAVGRGRVAARGASETGVSDDVRFADSEAASDDDSDGARTSSATALSL